jgi:hypothetical protein
VALVSVVLDHNLHAGGTVASAFGHTFVWPVALTLLAFIPAAFLPRRPAAAKIARGPERVPAPGHGEAIA